VERNPYQPPRTSVEATPDESAVRLGRFYRAINLVYVVVLLVGTGVIVASHPPLDLRTVAAALIYWAPAIGFFVLCGATRRVARRFLRAYAAYVMVLIAIFIWHLTTPLPDIRIGLQIVGINLLALVAALVQMRRGASLEPPAAAR